MEHGVVRRGVNAFFLFLTKYLGYRAQGYGVRSAVRKAAWRSGFLPVQRFAARPLVARPTWSGIESRHSR